MSELDELDRYRAPALDKGLDILELLAGHEAGLTQGEIAKALDRTPNEIYRMLDRLVHRSYVHRTEADRYELTLKLFELAHATRPAARLARQAVPVLQRFARDAGQSVHLVARDQNDLIVVAQVDGGDQLTISLRLGARVPPVNTAAGHAILAFARDDDERRLILDSQADRKRDRLTPALREHLHDVRQRGYAMLENRQIAGVTDLAAPVFGPLGGVVAALCCPFTRRLDQAGAPDRALVLEILVAAAQEISTRVLQRK